MTQFLLLTIYAPLSSWGDIAVGESRGSWDRPSRSAVLGLIGAALGVDRADQSGHDALNAGYGVAVRLDRPGTPMVDYHTTQTVAMSVVKRAQPATRAELLAAGEPQTILSRRSYRQDSLATVAIWAREGAPHTLEVIQDALLKPVFTLYAGRRANPLGLPMSPEVATAESLFGAFSQRSALNAELDSDFMRHLEPSGSESEIAHDACDSFPSGLQSIRQEVRRDSAAHRTRWQFANRVVEIGLPPSSIAEG